MHPDIQCRVRQNSRSTPTRGQLDWVIFGMLFCVKQPVAVNGVYLNLMSAKVYKRLYKHGGLFLSLGISEYSVVNFYRKGSAVAHAAEIRLGKGLYGRTEVR